MGSCLHHENLCDMVQEQDCFVRVGGTCCYLRCVRLRTFHSSHHIKIQEANS